MTSKKDKQVVVMRLVMRLLEAAGERTLSIRPAENLADVYEVRTSKDDTAVRSTKRVYATLTASGFKFMPWAADSEL